jgi:four helix bundle protein
MIRSLEDFKVYNLAMKLGEDVWKIVVEWDYFKKDTIGKQLVRAADSIAANLSEGLGRYHFKETKNFSYYSRGSLFETKTWITKATDRGLIENNKSKELLSNLELMGKMLNSYINTLGSGTSTVSEPEEEYIASPNSNTQFPNS